MEYVWHSGVIEDKTQTYHSKDMRKEEEEGGGMNCACMYEQYGKRGMKGDFERHRGKRWKAHHSIEGEC